MKPLIVIFLLIFAVLAFAWFYLQRAKARPTTTTTTTASTDEHPHETDPSLRPSLHASTDRSSEAGA